MFPIRDQNPTHSTAYVTIALVIVNCAVFLFGWSRPTVDQQRLTYKYGFIPAEFTEGTDEAKLHYQEHPPANQARDRQGRPLYHRFTNPPQPVLIPDLASAKAATALPAWINIFTCMFMHGGWMHLLGNMLFLWIFGNNIEDRLGSVLFVVFYIATGVVGSLTHTLFDPGYVPLVGASGAISGVMGAYVLLFPTTRILAIVPIGWYPATFSLPAWMYLGIYILLQNLWPAFRGGAGNVAYWAHIGGFVSGMALIYLFPHRKRPPPEQPDYDPKEDDADFVL